MRKRNETSAIAKVTEQGIRKNAGYYKRRLKCILRHLDISGNEVLDLGCGEMWLRSMKGGILKSYTGMDLFPFSGNPDFILGDLLNPAYTNERLFDSIFMLGVLDHASIAEKNRMLQLYQDKFKKYFVVSQCNPASWLLKMFGLCSDTVDMNSYFEACACIVLHLLKIPGTQFVFDMSRFPEWMKGWATEKVYVFKRVEG